jgi:hypothetical protein
MSPEFSYIGGRCICWGIWHLGCIKPVQVMTELDHQDHRERNQVSIALREFGKTAEPNEWSMEAIVQELSKGKK